MPLGWVARRPFGPSRIVVGLPDWPLSRKRLIPDFLGHGAEAYGFRGEVWTCRRIAKVLVQEFGVSYSRSQVSRLLKELEWTPQVPLTRALQRDEQAIERWRVGVWPEIKQHAQKERRTVVFGDESGFYLFAGGGPDLCSERFDADLEGMADAGSLVGDGGRDAPGKGLFPGSSGIAQRSAHRGVSHPSGVRGWPALAGDLGWLADSPQHRGERIPGRGSDAPNSHRGIAPLMPRT